MVRTGCWERANPRGCTFTHHDSLPSQGGVRKKGQRLPSSQVVHSATECKFPLYGSRQEKEKKEKGTEERKCFPLRFQRFCSLPTRFKHPDCGQPRVCEAIVESPWGSRSAVNQNTLMRPLLPYQSPILYAFLEIAGEH